MDPLIALISPLDAPPVAGLSFVFQPASVFASSTSTLTLVVSVPLDSPAVTMTPSNYIAVIFPAADATNPPPVPLVTTVTGITTATPNTWNRPTPMAGKLIFRPLNPTTLNPGDSLQFQCVGLSIVSTVGTPSVTIDVTSSASPGKVSTSLPITVQTFAPGVIAWADPPSVALNAPSTLRWTSQGGTTVVVSGFTSGPARPFPVGAEPPQTNTRVNPTVDSGGGSGGQFPYTVTLYAEPGHVLQGNPVTVHVYLHEPYIAQFDFVQPDKTLAPTITINYGDSVTARVRCIFVDPKLGIRLNFGSTSLPNNSITEATFNPTTALAPNDNEVVVTLVAPGWNKTARLERTVTYNPVRILYFKFTQWTSDEKGDHFSNMSWLTQPAETQQQSVDSDSTYPSVQRLHVQGPGGPLIQYLGTGNEPYLQIRYFSPSEPVTAGKPFTLQWFTNAATSLTLTSAGGQPINIPSGQIARGTSQPLTITAATEYVLTATGSTGETVSSYLTVTPA